MALKAQNWPFLHVTLLQEKILLSNVLHKEVTVYEGVQNVMKTHA